MSKFLIYFYIIRENYPFSVLLFLLFRLFKSKKVFKATIGGVPLKLRAHGPDLKVARRCLIEQEFGCLAELVDEEKASFIIDGGGYIGTAAIAFAKMFPDAKVVTVEPFEKNFELLRQNVAQFPNIIPVHAALVGQDRETALHDRNTGDWGLTIAHSVKDQPLPRIHTVQGLSVKTLLNQHGASRIDILKLDIEGAEKEVLESGGLWLPNTQLIIAELHVRIAPGCSDAFDQATEGLERVEIAGEKKVAVRKSEITKRTKQA